MNSVDEGTVWKHLKSGHVYIVLGTCMIEATTELGVLYRRCDGSTGPIWCRSYAQFTDGRFERVRNPQPPHPANKRMCPTVTDWQPIEREKAS